MWLSNVSNVNQLKKHAHAHTRAHAHAERTHRHVHHTCLTCLFSPPGRPLLCLINPGKGALRRSQFDSPPCCPRILQPWGGRHNDTGSLREMFTSLTRIWWNSASASLFRGMSSRHITVSLGYPREVAFNKE